MIVENSMHLTRSIEMWNWGGPQRLSSILPQYLIYETVWAPVMWSVRHLDSELIAWDIDDYASKIRESPWASLFKEVSVGAQLADPVFIQGTNFRLTINMKVCHSVCSHSYTRCNEFQYDTDPEASPHV